MRQLISVVLAAALPMAGWAADGAAPDPAEIIRPAGDSDLSEFQWVNRPVIVFADTEADPRYQEQMRNLERGLDALAARDVVVLTDTDPTARSSIRTQLRPRGFMLVVVGKDGGVKQRKPLPWTVREITAAIDKMPMRQREMLEQRGIGTGG